MLTELLENAIMLNLQYYSAQAYEAALKILNNIEQLGIGHTRAFINDPKSMMQNLTSEARNSENGYSLVSLGYLGGNYAVITPKSQTQFVYLLNRLDQETSARKGHAAFKFFSGNDFFIISDVGHNALSLRKNLSRFLVPSRLLNPTLEEIDKQTNINHDIQLRQTICGIIRSVMVKKLLDIDELPDNTYVLMEAYRNDIKRWGAFPFPELFNFMPSLRHKRNVYKAFSDNILEQEFEKLVQVLQTNDSPENANLLSATVVSLFKEANPTLDGDELLSALKQLSTQDIRCYFENPVVQSLPMILKAADNLTDAITICLEQLALDPIKLEMLQNEIDDSSILFGEELDISALKSLPILSAFYKETMRFDAPSAVPRFTQNGYSSASMTIPPNTMILFDLNGLAKGEQYWTNPQEFDPNRFLQSESQNNETELHKNNHTIGQLPFVPFSVGLRNCPAFAFTEVIFKAVIAKYVAKYDLTIIKRQDNDLIMNITPREQFVDCLSMISKKS